MARIQFPANLRPQTATYEILRSDVGRPGPWGKLQIVERPRTAKWRQTLGFVGLDGQLKRDLMAFAARIKIPGNTVRLPIFGYERGGPGGGTPVVDGASQAPTRSLASRGWPNSTTVLMFGDLVEINGHLHSLTADATTDGTGRVTLQLEPERKNIPSDGAPIHYLTPMALFQVAAGGITIQSRIENRRTVIDAVIDLVEAYSTGVDTDINAAAASLSMVGQKAALSTGSGLTAGTAALTLTPRQASLGVSMDIAAGVGSLAMTPRQAAVATGTGITASVATLSITAQVAAVDWGQKAVFINDAQAIDGGEVSQPFSSWSDTQITLGPLAKGSLVGPDVFVAVRNADGEITSWQAVAIYDELIQAQTATLTLSGQQASISQSGKAVFINAAAALDGGEVRQPYTSWADGSITLGALNKGDLTGVDFFVTVRNLFDELANWQPVQVYDILVNAQVATLSIAGQHASLFDPNTQIDAKTASLSISPQPAVVDTGQIDILANAVALAISPRKASVGPTESWQLAAGHFVPAKLPLKILYPRPDTETQSVARHRKALASKVYEIPIVAKGGSWPFKFELTGNTTASSISIGETLTINGTTGVHEVGATYGVLSWNAPASGTFTIEVRVTDQEGTTDIVSWQVTVDDSAFIFLDEGDAGSSNLGTEAEPYNDWATAFGTLTSTQNNQDKIVVCRAGTQTLAGFTDANSNFKITANNKPRSWMAYPGESVTLAIPSSGHFVLNGCDDVFFGDLTISGSSSSGYQFRVFAPGAPGMERHTHFRTTYTGYQGAGSGENDGHFYITSGSASGYNQYFVWSRSECTGSVGNWITSYQVRDWAIEHPNLHDINASTSSGANAGFLFIKDGGDGTTALDAQYSVTNFQCWDNINYGTGNILNPIAVKGQGGQKGVEIRYCRLGTKDGLRSVEFCVKDDPSPIDNFYLYRNSCEAAICGFEPAAAYSNVEALANVHLTEPTPVPGTNNAQWYTTIQDKLVDAGALDSSLNLTGTARTNYLGLRGAEIK